MTATRKLGISRKAQMTQQAYAAMKRGRLQLNDLSVQAVAQVCRMKAPNVYRYFGAPALDRIRACLSVAGTRELTASVQGVLDASKGDGSVLRAVAESYLQFARGAPEVYRLMFGTAIPEELWRGEEVGGEGLWEAKSTLYGVLGEVAQLARKSPERPEHRDDLMAKLVWMILHGMATMWIEEQPPAESLGMTASKLAEWVESIFMLGRGTANSSQPRRRNRQS